MRGELCQRGGVLARSHAPRTTMESRDASRQPGEQKEQTAPRNGLAPNTEHSATGRRAEKQEARKAVRLPGSCNTQPRYQFTPAERAGRGEPLPDLQGLVEAQRVRRRDRPDRPVRRNGHDVVGREHGSRSHHPRDNTNKGNQQDRCPHHNAPSERPGVRKKDKPSP